MYRPGRLSAVPQDRGSRERGEIRSAMVRERRNGVVGWRLMSPRMRHGDAPQDYSADAEFATERWGRVDAEWSLAGNGDTPFRLDRALTRTPVHDFDMVCEDLLLQLDPDLHSVALPKLIDHTHAEMAELLDCSISSVERKLRLIRNVWKSESTEISEAM